MPARNTVYSYRGELLPLKEIAARAGIYHKTLLYRIQHGRTIEQAVREPVRTPQECGRLAAQAWRARAAA